MEAFLEDPDLVVEVCWRLRCVIIAAQNVTNRQDLRFYTFARTGVLRHR